MIERGDIVRVDCPDHPDHGLEGRVEVSAVQVGKGKMYVPTRGSGGIYIEAKYLTVVKKWDWSGVAPMRLAS